MAVGAIFEVFEAGEAAEAAWTAYRAARAAEALGKLAQTANPPAAQGPDFSPQPGAGWDDDITKAQQQAAAGAKPQGVAVPQTQATGDAAASADCKDCKEKDPDKCKDARNGIRRKLYGAKKPRGIGGIASDPAQSHAKGLAQSICEFIHDAGAALGSHEESINNLLRGVKNEFEKLKKYNCRIPSDLAEEAGKYTKEAQARFNTRKMTQKITNFQDFCYQQANALDRTSGVFE